MAIANVPPAVSVPLSVIGPPEKVRPVAPPLTFTDVTLPAEDVVHEAEVPFVVRILPELPVCAGSRLLSAPFCVFAPVPPYVTPSTPDNVIVPDDVIGPPEKDMPVEPPLMSTEVTDPEPEPPDSDQYTEAPSVARTLPVLPV